MPDMTRRQFLLALFLCVVALGLGWQLGSQVTRRVYEAEIHAWEERFSLSGSGVTVRENPAKEVDLEILWTVWRLLDKHYVDPQALTVDELRYGAVRGLVEAMKDPYSAFMTPSESSDFQEVLRGKLEGIGAELTLRDGVIVVVAPLKGSPAARAGLLPLDVITAVDGVLLDGMNLQDAVRRIRGEKGTYVKIEVYRPATSDELSFDIVREEILVPSVEQEVLKTASGSLGYVSINQFGDDTSEAARRALETLRKERTLSGVILDLRFNGGGYLDGAIEIVSLFLDRGEVVSVEKRGEERDAQFVLGDPVMPDMPLVVLINEGSASASEIVAGALQDHKRAVIMGTKSFGKGTVQDVIDLPGGSSLRLTIANWKTPNGRDLGKEGVTPDYVIERTTEDYAADHDPQKAAAVEYLLDGDVPESK
jgi:carboxyl-terminal processing protease